MQKISKIGQWCLGGLSVFQSQVALAGSCSVPVDPEALGLNDPGFDTRWLLLALAVGLLLMAVARKRKAQR